MILNDDGRVGRDITESIKGGTAMKRLSKEKDIRPIREQYAIRDEILKESYPLYYQIKI